MYNDYARILVALAALLLVVLPFSHQAAAADLELVGEAAGLVLIPPKGKLFELKNMEPGDSRTATLAIKNSHHTWYDLWMEAEETVTGGAGLLEAMELSVACRGRELHRGPAGALLSKKIWLGRFYPGEKGELEVTVHLPGPETGNAYQGKSAGIKWIFSACTGGGPPPARTAAPQELPQTGGPGAAPLYLLLGAPVLLAGLLMVRKSRRC